MENRKNILVGCTGSVASLKVPLIVNTLNELGFNVKVVPTDHSRHFFDTRDLHRDVKVHSDSDEWEMWKKRGDPVLHIELRKWADLFVIAPLDANTMAKLACGLCDNLLTCIARAWDPVKPLLFAPAMNTYMWNHPITGEQIQKLASFGYTEIPCVSKTLMCGDSGLGAMAEYQDVVKCVCSALSAN